MDLLEMDVGCVEEADMKLFYTEDSVRKDMEERKKKYLGDKRFQYVEEATYDDAICFRENNRDGYFYICIAALEVEQ